MKPDLLAGAARNITAGMAQAGVRRLICVSAAGAFIQGDPDSGALTRAILPRVLAKPFADVRQMEAVIRASDLGTARKVRPGQWHATIRCEPDGARKWSPQKEHSEAG